MHELKIHKHARKAFKKASPKIREKILLCLKHLRQIGLSQFPYPIKALQGPFKKFRYFEIKVDKDYRIIFRQEDSAFYIRDAGTHNSLGTG